MEEAYGDRVYLPETYKNAWITEWNENDGIRDKIFDKVKILWIPASIRRIRIYNGFLPKLKRVEIDSGRCLLRNKV